MYVMIVKHGRALVPSGFGRGKYDEHNATVVIFVSWTEPVSVPDPGIMQRPEHPIFAKNILAVMSGLFINLK